MQSRPLPRLRFREVGLRDEEEEKCQCTTIPIQSIVCEICYERTALDAESISELEKLIPVAKTPVARNYAEPRAPYDRAERAVPKSQVVPSDEPNKSKSYERQPVREYAYGSGGSGVNSALMTGISSNKICAEHHEEEILYFCFDCKCECICPECIIHGIDRMI